MQDVSDFNENRYFLGKQQKELFEKIDKGVKTTTKLLEYGIPYMNSSLIYGEPGTGKQSLQNTQLTSWDYPMLT